MTLYAGDSFSSGFTGGDGYTLFNGKVDARGVCTSAYPGGNTNGRTKGYYINFTGLNPNLTYTWAGGAAGDRTETNYTRYELVGATSATNSSSSGVFATGTDEGCLYTDIQTFVPGAPAAGKIAKFTNINPGSDGQISICVYGNYYGATHWREGLLSCFMLQVTP